MRPSAMSVILVLLSVFLLIGCIFVYHNGGGDYQASAEMNSDGKISYSLSGNATEYRYSVFSDTSLPDKLYLYLDGSYASEFNNHYIQSEFFGVLKQMLERRNYSSVEYVDADGLIAVMNEYGSAVFFVSGALPDTIYDGDVNDSLFKTWMENGGKVFWSGPEIGRYVSTKNGVIDKGTGFFGGNVNNDKDSLYGYDESEMFRYTEIRNDDCLYGLKKDQADSIAISFVSDNGYSTLSVAKMFNGNITVFGGNIATTENVSQVLLDRTYCADTIIYGLTYQSEGLDCGNGVIKDGVSSITNIDVSSYSNRMFFISVGQNASEWSKSIVL